jgi:pimeloyl-ACP methyl ester carboxylesterase
MNNHFILAGNGPHRVIALHGWFGSARGWGGLPDAFDQRNFTYAFIDCRGYGGASGRGGDYSMDEVARDTVALADHLGWDRFSLVGHSMGGKAIQQVLLDAPERVRKLVAITPVPASGVPFDAAGWGLFSSAAHDPQARKAIIDMSTGNRLSSFWLDSMVRLSEQNSRPDAVAAYLSAWARSDFSARVAGNAAQIKVIVGETDPGLNAEVMRATYLRWYPHAQLEIIRNAGHYPMYETPVALATSIDSFLGA